MGRIFWQFVLLIPFLVPLPGLSFLNKISYAIDRSSLIKGWVVDAETKATIEFANISLFHQPDTIPFQITATNAKGEFTFSNLQAGSYSIKVHFMGFKDFTTQPFKLTGKETVFRLEPIPIHIESQSLGEVIVRVNTANPVYQLDKKTIYVENQLSGAGGSAADLVLKLPSITQSADGQISIHGNTNLLVYINGKPSSLKGDELLQNTSAAEVKRIELITSPSAKYDASGSGGIINLITKKSTLDGFNGNMLVSTDSNGGYSSDFLLNYKYHQFSFFSGFDHNRRRNKGEIDYVTDYLTDLSRFTKTGLQKSQRINTGFRAGIDYQPTSADKISISGNAGNFETTNNGNWMTTTLNTSATQNTSIRNAAIDGNVRPGSYGGADATYEHKFGSINKILSFSSLWNTVKFDDQYLNQINDLDGKEQIKQTTLLDKTNYNLQLNADYITPTGKVGNLEIGYQLSLNKEHETYHSELSNPPPPVVTDQKTQFNGVIHAGYGTWQLKFKRLNLKAGLRAENLNRKMITLDNRYLLNRFDLYPSLNSSFKIDSTQEIILNYSRRTDQLKTIQLDPLPRWYEFNNVMVGNPNLKNEITDKIELAYLLNFHNIILSSELYFYNKADKIEVVSSLYRDEIIQYRPENMGNERTLGIEFYANWTPGSRFSINEKFDFIGSHLDVRLSQIAQKRSYRQCYSVTTANYSISPTTFLELNFSYYGPSLTAQSNVDQVFLAGLSFRQMLFKKKLTFTLTGRDILGLYRRVEYIQGADFNKAVTICNKFPIRFALSYKFNQYKRDDRKAAKSPVAE